MIDNKSLYELYESLLQFQENLHEQNQKRIKKGIRFFFTVPMFFLVLMFVSGSSKIVFLVLWIASMFILAVYLLTVEYMDYLVQEKINEIQGKENEAIESLIQIPEAVGKRVEAVRDRLNAKGGEQE